MPTPKRGPRLGGGAAHQRHLLANQASDLFRHGRITTTQAKAKQLRPYAERLITKAKQGDLASRRAVLAKLRGDRDVVAYLFEEVAPRFADRNGGYTRTLKLGPRQGDNTPMVIIELVDRGTTSGDEAIEEAKAGRSRGLFGRRRKATADTGGAPAGTDVLADVDDEDEDEDDASGLAAQAAPGEDAPPVPEDTLESDPAGAEGPEGPKHGGKDADTGTV